MAPCDEPVKDNPTLTERLDLLECRANRIESNISMSSASSLGVDFRVAKLEKEVSNFYTFAALALCIGAYFAMRWYVNNVGSFDKIPGVLP